MSKEAFQDLLLLMDSELEERERKPPRQLWRWKSRGRRTWEMRRGHTVPPGGGGESTNSNPEDDEEDNGDQSAVCS